MKIKFQPDKAKAIRKALKERRNFVIKKENEKFLSIVCENYYEIIKELTIAIFILRGIKFIDRNSYKELLENLRKLINLDPLFINFLQDFRTRRNGSMYYGQPFNENYLENHLEKILDIIKRLDSYLDKELGVKNEK
jgi:type IV secretory pathway VirB4 component